MRTTGLRLAAAAALAAAGMLTLPAGPRAQQAPAPPRPDALFRAAAADPGLALGIELGRSTYTPGSPLTLGVTVNNPGNGPVADFFLGLRLPDGATAVSVRLGGGPVFGSLANLGTLRPVAAGINLAGSFAVSQPAIFQYQFNGSEPVGEYLVYFAAVRAGGLNDGVIGDGELLALQTTTFTFATGGILLPGSPTAPALQATSDFHVSTGVAASQISVDADGRRLARTQIEVEFAHDATVSQVNAALASVQGRIVAMLPGVAILLVEIPDPGTLEALAGLADGLRARAGVVGVVLQGFESPEALPDNIAVGSSDLDKIDHLIAARAHAAWNTRAVLDRSGVVKPLVLVGDYFGLGPPGTPPFAVSATTADYGRDALDQHGYHVLGIIGASLVGDGSPAGLATGLLPGITPVRAVDYIIDGSTKRTTGDVQTLLLFRLDQHPGNVVLNTSLGFTCRSGNVDVPCTPATMQAHALSWLKKVRGSLDVTVAGSGREARYLHATSAGNVKVSGDIEASTNSAYAAAALLGGLTNGSGVAVPNALNTLVVENRLASDPAPYLPSCLASNSKRVVTRTSSTALVNVSAVGTDVWSMRGPAIDAGNESGTSMATPQVAALATWIWALRPNLTNRQVMQLITSLARQGEAPSVDFRCDLSDAAAAIDAFASVLATDQGIADAPVRLTLLDVTNTTGTGGPDQRFDEGDVTLFLQQFSQAGGAREYSRYDLNGDGNTGGSGTDRFDLDFDRVYQTAARTTETVTRTVNEAAATDIDVLCHYAHTPLFTGDRTQRDATLGSACGPTLEVTASSMTAEVIAELPSRARVSVLETKLLFAPTQSVSATLDDQVTTNGTTVRAVSSSTATRTVALAAGGTTIAGAFRSEPQLLVQAPQPGVAASTSAQSSQEVCVSLPVSYRADYSVVSNAQDDPSWKFHVQLTLVSGNTQRIAIGGDTGSVLLPPASQGSAACVRFSAAMWTCSLDSQGNPRCDAPDPQTRAPAPLTGSYRVTLTPAP